MSDGSYIIIDGGGTATKGYLFSSEKQLIAHHELGAGNFIASFDEALNNYRAIIKFLNQEHSVREIIIFAAGFFNLPIDQKNQVFQKLQVDFSGKISIQSDSSMSLFLFTGQGAVITLGTGTALVHNINASQTPEILFGLGHLIKDPLSGYAIAQRLIFMVLMSEDKKAHQELFRIYEVNSQGELVTMIHQNQQKTTIANKTRALFNSFTLKPFLLKTIHQEVQIFMHPRVKAILMRAPTIVLNGSIANHLLIQSFLKRIINLNKTKWITTEDRNKTLTLICQNYPWSN